MGVKVSDRTVRRRLVNAGLRARIARKKPFLNVVQRQKKSSMGKKTCHPDSKDWKKVIFIDETRSPYSAATEFAMFADEQDKIALQNV